MSCLLHDYELKKIYIKASFFPSTVTRILWEIQADCKQPSAAAEHWNWMLNVLLAGMFLATIACMQHWMIHLPCILKRRNSSILLFAACPLFISCILYVWQNGGRRAVFRKALRQRRWCIRGLKWTMICNIGGVNQSHGKSHFSEEKKPYRRW